ncbi:DUF2293 domain-containing protein [Paenochrobactrum glaciei]|uniref:DUF2293 domain-containing protein n=1 Tax=Paenochrobactrum glaciei TaxID=486407 RepID=A0ABP3R3H1_9HYPH
MQAKTNRQKLIAKSLTLLIPGSPYSDAEPIRAAALSPHMRELTPPVAIWLATVAYIRHQYTDYDALRDEGYDKESARFFVLDAINDKLTEWRATRLLSPDDDEMLS